MQQELYTLAFQTRGNYLFVRATGVRTQATVTAMAREIFDAALAHHQSKVLIDVSDLKGKLGILDSYIMVTEVFEKLRGKGLQRAAVVDEQGSSRRDWFLETVARNRGFNFRVFTSQPEASEWLESGGTRSTS